MQKTYLGLTGAAWLHIGRHCLYSALAATVAVVASDVLPAIQVNAQTAFLIPVVTTALVGVKTFLTDQASY